MKNFFRIIDHEKFGRLMEGWAKDRSKRPRTIQELKNILDNAPGGGIGYEMPDMNSEFRLSEILYCDLRDKQLTLVIPTPKQLKQGLKEARNGTGPYPLPQEYQLNFDCPPKSVTEADERESILYARVADYCIGSCM